MSTKLAPILDFKTSYKVLENFASPPAQSCILIASRHLSMFTSGCVISILSFHKCIGTMASSALVVDIIRFCFSSSSSRWSCPAGPVVSWSSCVSSCPKFDVLVVTPDWNGCYSCKFELVQDHLVTPTLTTSISLVLRVYLVWGPVSALCLKALLTHPFQWIVPDLNSSSCGAVWDGIPLGAAHGSPLWAIVSIMELRSRLNFVGSM